MDKEISKAKEFRAKMRREEEDKKAEEARREAQAKAGFRRHGIRKESKGDNER